MGVERDIVRGGWRPEGSGSRAGRLRTLYVVAAAVLAALVPLIMAAGLWLRAELDKGRRDVNELLAVRAESLSGRLDSAVGQQLSVLQAIASLPSLDGPDLPAFHAAAGRLLQPMPDWRSVRLVAPVTGRRILDAARPLGEPLGEEGAMEGVDEAVRLRRPAVRSRAGPPGTEPGVVLYAPVIRGGEVRWVLAAAMRAEALQAALVEEGGDPAVLTLVVDENGLVLARSRSPEAQVGRPATPSLRDGLAGRPAGSFRALTLEGREVSATFQRSPLTGWSAVAALDRRELDALTRRTLWATVAAVALSLTLAGVLAVFLLSHVVERRLSDERLLASRALGDLDARLLAKSQEALADQRRAATEREVLLREIYHRVKNNLQIVQSLLRLGSRDLRPEQREPFEGAVRRIGAMARVHTLLYNSPDMSSIDLKEYLEGLVRETADAFDAEVRGIRPVLEVESMRIPLDTAVPLAFIAVEFLTNAFRHGFPPGRGGTVTVRAAQEGEDGVLVVSDDGVGLGPEGRPAGGRRPMGLSIAARLVQQIGGALETPGPGGSLYRVTFPLGENAPRVGQTTGTPIPPPPEAGARAPGPAP